MVFAEVNWLPASVSAFLVGLSKTGMPGAAIPSVWLMAEAVRDAKASVGIITPLLLVGDVFAVSFYRRHAQWDRLWRLVPFIAIGMVPAFLVLSVTSGEQLRPVLGYLILGLLSLEIGRRWFKWENVPQSWWFVGTMGVLAGFGTALGNAAGPVTSIYFLANRLPKQQFVGTMAWLFFVVNLSKVLPYRAMGMITAQTLMLDLKLAPIVVISALVGVVMLPLVPQRWFDGIVLALAALGGVRLIVG